MEQFSLSGKVAIITGASRGIGEAIAHTYAKAGAKVVLASRKLEGVTSVAESIKQEGGEALSIATHMGEPDAIQQLVQKPSPPTAASTSLSTMPQPIPISECSWKALKAHGTKCST